MIKPLLADDYGIPRKKEFIVVTKPDIDHDEFKEILKRHDIDINIDYDGLKRHYLVAFLEEKFDALLAEDDVLMIEPADKLVTLMESQLIKVDETGHGGNWGLTRICHNDDWNDTTWYPNTGNYVYFRDGTGVDVYVVDTGCRITHSEFGGRAKILFDYYLSPSSPAYGIDQQGHGTHVASTIAGKKYGVAKNANLLISRIFETGGATLAAVIAGINACTVHHKNKKSKGINRPSIMNLSIGGPATQSEGQAVNDCINEGIVVCAAAGNDGKNLDEDGYEVMPAEIERAITVGSCDIKDRISSFSNYGRMIDVFAPGHYICAAGIENDTAEKMLSGTSMATPHVTGVCALYAQGKSMTSNADDVKEIHDWIKTNATSSTLTLTEAVSSAGSPNKLLFSTYITSDFGNLPVLEVSRKVTNEVVEKVSEGDPEVSTTYVDESVSTVDNEGNTTIITTRYYTEVTTVIVTTTTTTTPITVITYSDGSIKTERGKSIVSSSTTVLKNTDEYSEVIDEKFIPILRKEVSRDITYDVKTEITKSDPQVVTTYIDVTEKVVNPDNSTTITVTRNYTDTITVIVTTTKTTTPIVTISYSDGSTEVVYEDSTTEITTNNEVSIETRSKIISQVTNPAPTIDPVPEPEPSPKPKKERNWRKRGNWRRIRNLIRRIDHLERIVPSDKRYLLEEIEDAAEEFVDADGRSKLDPFWHFMDVYYSILKQIR